MTAEPIAAVVALTARSLGARGSRSAIGHDDPAGDPGDQARRVLAGMAGWWQQRAHAHGLAGPWHDLTYAIDGLAPPPSHHRPVDLAGCTGEEIGDLYVTALDVGVRSRHGRHYTPPALAGHLWALTGHGLGMRRPGLPLPGLVRDPACGAGALLLPAVRQHLAALSAADPRVTLAGLPGHVEGIDADPSAVWIANVLLAAESLPLLARLPAARRRPLPRLARVGDGLADPDRAARAVVMNPPYGRVRLDDGDRQRWAPYLYGHANLYGLFLAAGLEALDDDGVLAALVPTSFLAGRYFEGLRREIARQAPMRAVTFVESRSGVFSGVLQETCLAVFTRRKPRKTVIASANGTIRDVAKVAAPRGQQPWLLPRRADDAHVAAAAATMPLTLADAGWQVSTGPLVWNRRRADLGARAAPGTVKVVWAADLDGGALHQDRSRDAMRWLTLRDRDEQVMVLSTPAILVQRTTAPEQTRRLVGVHLDGEDLDRWGGRVAVENHVNVLRPAAADPLIDHATLARVLATATIDRLMRCISGSVAVSAYELEALPLPAAHVLKGWKPLDPARLERAVAAAYRPRTP